MAEPDGAAAGDGWARSTEAIAARNVVDGIALVRTPSVWTIAAEANRDRVKTIVDDIVDALDAVGDLLLAESVHQLTIGTPHALVWPQTAWAAAARFPTGSTP